MRIIDRYISGSIFRMFFSTILVFCFLYILIDVTSNLPEILSRSVPVRVLMQYYLSFLPIIIVQTATIACLISTLFTFSHLNSNNEVVVLRTAGMNFWQICKPALFFALFVSIVLFWMNERFVPKAAMNSESIRDENIILKVDSDRKKNTSVKNLTFYGLKNRLYFVDTFYPGTMEMEGITIVGQDDNQNLIEKVAALKGKWTGIAWKFSNCQITTFEAGNVNAPKEIKYYDEKLMDIKEKPQDFMRQRLNVSSMNIRELREYIKRFSSSGATKALNNLRVDLHQKIAFPFGNLVIVLVGLPLALMVGRRKAMTFTALGVAILVGFLFYVANAVGLALGKGGVFPPFLSAWLAPVLFLCLGLYLVKKKF